MDKILDFIIIFLFVFALIIYGYSLLKIIYRQLNSNVEYNYKSSNEWKWLKSGTYLFLIAFVIFIINAFYKN